MTVSGVQRRPVDAPAGVTSTSLREQIRATTLQPEKLAIQDRFDELAGAQQALSRATARARQWVNTVRESSRSRPLVDSMLEQFPLDTASGKAMMGLAEALLRTPDSTRANQLVAEKLAVLEAKEARGQQSLLLKTGFALIGHAGRLLPDVSAELAGKVQPSTFVKPVTAPLIRATLRQSVQMLGKAFVFAEDIGVALDRARAAGAFSPSSFDMLGEGARTDADAQRYFRAYLSAVEAVSNQPQGTVHTRSGISVKLSALEPRYSLLQREGVEKRLIPMVIELARRAAAAGVGLTIDAEEADRLDLSLDIIAAVARDEQTRSWDGFGCAVQAYGLRAPLVIEWLAQLARDTGRRMTIRLVKGAYWDSEIKRSQERGLAGFPVYTTKAATDVSYLACAQRLFAANDVIYPQFATHNAFTIAAILEFAPSGARFEFQRLHGMGDALYEAVRQAVPDLPLVRVYAPVGTHQDLLPYLVRRLLENGANSSFVHQFLNKDISVESLVRDPISQLNDQQQRPESGKVRLPRAMYAPERNNSSGPDLGNPAELEALSKAVHAQVAPYVGGPIIGGKTLTNASISIVSPTNTSRVVGSSRDATDQEISDAMFAAASAQPGWNATSAEKRAAALDKAADLLEQRETEFLRLLVQEAGKTIPDAIAELREAIDFCRYYAVQGRALFGTGEKMPGPTGESNVLTLHGRGVFVCISPWNFPLAIFMGQITAALMAGNAVVAKPAPATPLVAHAATRLLHEAGIPANVLQLTPADGPPFGRVAFGHPALAGVVFTGSTKTAAVINRALANREGPILPLIAETGGVNAMIVDATALPEQVVDDAVTSSFTSAGQRCSALRVLYVQDEIADRVIEMLVGAMKTLSIGDPAEFATDVGPLISAEAVQRMQAHATRMSQEAKLVHACSLDGRHASGYFFAPHLFELNSLDQLKTEEFGPILHVVRYAAKDLPQVLQAVRSTGFGLTLGVHSRVEGVVDHIFRGTSVGNTYVNRNMIGAVVGVQPFGGQGLSGTGPKAGGPHYLLRFATERTLTINTAALGGNVELMA